jgi:transcriptional regulator with XRE-family HTH domain
MGDANRVAGGRIRALRQTRGMSQQALAERAGCLRTSVTNIEAGRQAVVTDTFVAIAESLGVSPASLLPGYAESTADPRQDRC